MFEYHIWKNSDTASIDIFHSLAWVSGIYVVIPIDLFYIIANKDWKVLNSQYRSILSILASTPGPKRQGIVFVEYGKAVKNIERKSDIT